MGLFTLIFFFASVYDQKKKWNKYAMERLKRHKDKSKKKILNWTKKCLKGNIYEQK